MSHKGKESLERVAPVFQGWAVILPQKNRSPS